MRSIATTSLYALAVLAVVIAAPTHNAPLPPGPQDGLTNAVMGNLPVPPPDAKAPRVRRDDISLDVLDSYSTINNGGPLGKSAAQRSGGGGGGVGKQAKGVSDGGATRQAKANQIQGGAASQRIDAARQRVTAAGKGVQTAGDRLRGAGQQFNPGQQQDGAQQRNGGMQQTGGQPDGSQFNGVRQQFNTDGPTQNNGNAQQQDNGVVEQQNNANVQGQNSGTGQQTNGAGIGQANAAVAPQSAAARQQERAEPQGNNAADIQGNNPADRLNAAADRQTLDTDYAPNRRVRGGRRRRPVDMARRDVEGHDAGFYYAGKPGGEHHDDKHADDDEDCEDDEDVESWKPVAKPWSPKKPVFESHPDKSWSADDEDCEDDEDDKVKAKSWSAPPKKPAFQSHPDDKSHDDKTPAKPWSPKKPAHESHPAKSWSAADDEDCEDDEDDQSTGKFAPRQKPSESYQSHPDAGKQEWPSKVRDDKKPEFHGKDDKPEFHGKSDKKPEFHGNDKPEFHGKSDDKPSRKPQYSGTDFSKGVEHDISTAVDEDCDE